MKKLEKPVAVIASLALIIVMLISAVDIAAYGDYDFFRKEYEKYEVLDDVDMEMDDLMYVTREMMAYLRGERDVLSVETTVGGETVDAVKVIPSQIVSAENVDEYLDPANTIY